LESLEKQVKKTTGGVTGKGTTLRFLSREVTLSGQCWRNTSMAASAGAHWTGTWGQQLRCEVLRGWSSTSCGKEERERADWESEHWKRER
jgi:hypothetical protein